MKITDIELDILIRDSVQKINVQLPTTEKSESESGIKKGWWLSALAVATILALAVLSPYTEDISKEKEINEIRTELTLQNKNIKILWVQKADFQIPESMRGGKQL